MKFLRTAKTSRKIRPQPYQSPLLPVEAGRHLSETTAILIGRPGGLVDTEHRATGLPRSEWALVHYLDSLQVHTYNMPNITLFFSAPSPVQAYTSPDRR